MPDDAAAVPDNYLVLPFADGDYKFALPIGQVIELQEKCGAGVGEILARLMAGRYRNNTTGETLTSITEAKFRAEDVREVVRLGLIGGNEGMVDGQQIDVPPTKAVNLVRNYVDTRPLAETWPVACAVLSAFVVGYVDPDKAQKKTVAPQPPESVAAGQAGYA